MSDEWEGDGPTEDENWPDEDWPDEDWADEDESNETLPCPECGESIYEDAEQCPYCGNYVVHSTSPWSGKPTWWVILGLLGIALKTLALAIQF